MTSLSRVFHKRYQATTPIGASRCKLRPEIPYSRWAIRTGSRRQDGIQYCQMGQRERGREIPWRRHLWKRIPRGNRCNVRLGGLGILGCRLEAHAFHAITLWRGCFSSSYAILVLVGCLHRHPLGQKQRVHCVSL